MVTYTNAGIAAIAKMISNVSPPDAFTYIATGSGSTAESSSSTALASENTAYGFQRAAATCSFISPASTKMTHVFTASGGTATLREVGAFNALIAGDMLLRHVLSESISYEDTDSVTITITTTLGRA